MNHANNQPNGQPTGMKSLTRTYFLPIKTAIMGVTDNCVKMHIKVTGRVQGVGFRFWIMQQARRLDLAGTVSNKSDYSVEAVFYGSIKAVEEMVQLCRRGPAGAQVVDLTVVSREAIAICPENFKIHS